MAEQWLLSDEAIRNVNRTAIFGSIDLIEEFRNVSQAQLKRVAEMLESVMSRELTVQDLPTWRIDVLKLWVALSEESEEVNDAHRD